MQLMCDMCRSTWTNVTYDTIKYYRYDVDVCDLYMEINVMGYLQSKNN